MFRFVPRLFGTCSAFVPLFLRDIPRLFAVCFTGKFFDGMNGMKMSFPRRWESRASRNRVHSRDSRAEKEPPRRGDAEEEGNTYFR